MIQLNVDFSLLNKYFGIPAAKIFQYGQKSLEEIMEIEAKEGNKKAEDFQKILQDPRKLLEIFRLVNIENKFAILQNMSEDDLDNLLPYLNQEQLSLGLYFFTDEKLIMMSKELPIEELALMIFSKFSTNIVLSLMDDSAMDKILKEPDMERGYAQEYLQGLDRQMLESIMVNAYGEDYRGKTQKEYVKDIENIEDGQFTKFLLSFDRENKIGLISGMMEQDPDLLTLFQPEDMVRPMEILLLKEDKIKMMKQLDPEFLVPMIQELPIDLTQIVLTQIDPNDFSEILAKDFKDILSSAVIFKG